MVAEVYRESEWWVARAVWLTLGAWGAGDPSLRLKNGSAQNDKIRVKNGSAQDDDGCFV
jgi:hypothetical protein